MIASAGSNSILKLVTDQTISGITAGFDTPCDRDLHRIGLMVSSIVLPQRFTGLR